MSEWESGQVKFNLDVEDGRLAATGELDFDVEREFRDACMRLLEGDARSLLVDLGQVSFICSSCLGTLFLLHERAKGRGAAVRVRLNRKIAPICEMMGLRELMDVEVVG